MSLGTTVAVAQVSGDQTLPAGENTIVNQDNSVYEITGGATRDANLFHSFEAFSLDAGQEAFFNHAEGIDTILGRVTGGSASDINGLIRTPDFSAADIFLINPQGVVFGPNAALDVGGSFIVSTAEQITFADGTAFNMTNTQTVSLTISHPVGLGLGQNSLDIRNEAFLEVPTGETLALLGNGIEFVGNGSEFELFTDVLIPENRLFAPAGRVTLASVAPGSSINLLQNTPDSSGWMLDRDTIANADLRDIELSNSAVIDTSSIFIDEFADIGLNIPPSVASGAVQLLGRQISVDSSLVLSANLGPSKGGGLTAVASEQFTLSGGTLFLDTALVEGDGGDIAIEVAQGNIELLGESMLTAQSIGVGATGSITLDASNVRLHEGTNVSTLTFGEGAGGDLTVNVAGGTVELFDASRLLAQSEGGATGAAGDLTLNTSRLTVRDGSDISTSTFSEGAAGTLTINALPSSADASGGVIELSGNSRVLAQSEAGATGAAGDVTLNTSRLNVRDGSDISTSTFSEGAGGSLTINATTETDGAIELLGGSFIRAQSEAGATGAAGDIKLNTSRLSLQDGAQISASTLGNGSGGTLSIDARDGALVGTIEVLDDSRILVQSDGAVDAGNLILNTSQLRVQNGSQISTSTLGNGSGGTLSIDARDGVSVGMIEVLDDSRIFTQSDAVGDAGDLTLNTSQLRVRGDSQVSTFTLGEGTGGTLTVNALDGLAVGTIEVLGDSHILAQSDTVGDAGDLTLNTSQLRVRGESQVSTTTFGEGAGGRLTINALDGLAVGRIELSDDSRILVQSDAAGTTGVAGNLTLNTSQLRVRSGSEISTSTLGESPGGNLAVDANTVILNDGIIASQTLLGTGGNLHLQVRETVSLQNGSRIVTNPLFPGLAGVAGVAGESSGGNVEITIPNGFIIVFPEGDSEISGNQIDITALGVFGLAGQSTPIATESRSSHVELIELDTLIAMSCLTRASQPEGRFTIPGAGGLPYSPEDSTGSYYPAGDIQAFPSVAVEVIEDEWQPGDPIIEPENVLDLADGRLVFARGCDVDDRDRA